MKLRKIVPVLFLMFLAAGLFPWGGWTFSPAASLPAAGGGSDAVDSMGNPLSAWTPKMRLGALLPLTGGLSTYGKNHRAAIGLAVEHANAFLEDTGRPWRLEVVVRDTGGIPDDALTQLKILSALGIKCIIGPVTSAEVSRIKDYVAANRILIISQSSTGGSLAIPDDSIFRFFPSEPTRGRVLARVMYDDGIRYAVPVWGHMAWLRETVDGFRSRFVELGGTVDEGVEYTSEDNFLVVAQALAERVALALPGSPKVGVLYIGWDDTAALFQAANDLDMLKQVRWYGMSALDGVTGKDEAASFAVDTRFVNLPDFVATRSEKYSKVREQLMIRLGGEPDWYSYAAYDAVWAYTNCLLAVNRYDAERLRAVLPSVAEMLFGASGWMMLDIYGDRKAADADLFVVEKVDDSTYSWKLIGTYEYIKDSVSWL